ncbi:MAG TPA: hypothetical protein IGR64_09120 [Leptolyngbyaceae cyanobacterium M65_K2018_010]|nr:hypothetical protein [Leptolyngbyaceae cyanobacterium M65_K2018_010]
MLTDTLTEALQSVLLTPLQRWLTEHPLLGWLAGHPLWTLALVGLGLLLFAGLWSAIARLTEGFWLTLVRLPFQLGGWLFATTASLLVKSLLVKQWAKTAKPEPSPDRLGEILARLATLQSEQAELLAEMRQLLADRH